MMKRPASNCSADGRQRLRTGGGQEARKGMTSPSQRFPCSECESEEVERLVRKVVTAVRILAVDDLCLLGMQHQLAGRKADPLTHSIAPAPLRRSCSDKWHRPRTSRTECADSFATSTRRTHSAGTGLPGAG